MSRSGSHTRRFGWCLRCRFRRLMWVHDATDSGLCDECAEVE